LRKSVHLPAIPPHAEGRFAIVTNVEAGCGGREISQRLLSEMRTNEIWRTAKPCGPDAPTLAFKFVIMRAA
jgi:hypothetical protein